MLETVVAYCRLSKEDGDDDISTSITNQKKIIEDFAIAHNMFIKDFYIDDGQSGYTMNRPGFNRLKNDVVNAFTQLKEGMVNKFNEAKTSVINKVNEIKTRLLRGKEIAEQINILGDDGVPVEYHVTFWKSELIDFVILQQDAFDEIDAVTPLERQEELLDMVIDICHTDFEFENFVEVMDYFKKLINLCKQMNYSEFGSEKYHKFKGEVEKMVAEQSVK